MANLIRRRDDSSNVTRRPQQEFAWDPFRMMDALLRWDPLRGAMAGEAIAGRLSEFIPTFDVKETKDGYVVKADLPGVDEEDVDVSVTGNVVTVSGKREQENRDEGDQYFAVERTYGMFSRSFSLPDGANLDEIKADLKNGVLSLYIPKRPDVQPKRISIGRGEGSKTKA